LGDEFCSETDGGDEAGDLEETSSGVGFAEDTVSWQLHRHIESIESESQIEKKV
jgi:hypothetical protein